MNSAAQFDTAPVLTFSSVEVRAGTKTLLSELTRRLSCSLYRWATERLPGMESR